MCKEWTILDIRNWHKIDQKRDSDFQDQDKKDTRKDVLTTLLCWS